MPAVLPKARDTNLKDVTTFDSSPANLSLFDTQIRNALNRWDIPVYNGSSLVGNEEDGFTFCAATADQALCSALSNKFTDAAAQWWDDYDSSSDKPAPNCWKKATNANSIPEGLLEVSVMNPDFLDLITLNITCDRR